MAMLTREVNNHFLVNEQGELYFYCIILLFKLSSLKARPNVRNISTQHCCVQHVGRCWIKFENVKIFCAKFLDVV